MTKERKWHQNIKRRVPELISEGFSGLSDATNPAGL